MTQLNDFQLILLSNAAQTSNGNVFPLPDTVTDRDRADNELKTLLRRGLVSENQTANPAASWRSEENIQFGLTITEAGNTAIGLGNPNAEPEPNAATNTPADALAGPARDARAGSKIANVLSLLRRDGGATLAEMVEATGWLPHTTRAALTGLKKKGHCIDKTKRDDTTCYHIAGVN